MLYGAIAPCDGVYVPVSIRERRYDEDCPRNRSNCRSGIASPRREVLPLRQRGGAEPVTSRLAASVERNVRPR